ncbi:reverse transcriptase/maturase family protein [Tepidibacter formicigenes]|uniref:Retron-type reverse transcriptase n=1 Tax=Tepidibacter formicigenes DSM 15518 TaxID=1123349 RepID=A0A1M6Q242_9FIRM|nr:reverse transcriptase/maturase family protein [Tepidibacter formicigenes]SHK14295.1 Retron-type reverse transcriptase [Tepidibacter formicigenes DSM 15518]
MKTIKNLYPKIYDFENLYQAWEQAQKGKRFREEVLAFANDLEANLIDIQNHLIYGTYRVGKYRPFYVYEPKKRLIMALPFRDRVVQWAIYRQLFPLLDKQFIFDSYACRKGKGTHAAADRLQYWLRQTDRKPERYYYLKLDISKYFYRVDHAVLIEILKRKIKDKQLIELLCTIINCEEMKFGLPAGVNPDMCPEDERLSEVGMPIGNLTSQMFANLYLNELDNYAKHGLRLHYYIRYMDDVIILHPDKKYLAEVKNEIETFLNEKLNLQLNNKTAIRPCSMGIDFVGFRIWATHRKLKKKTAKKIKTRVKYLVKAKESGEVTQETFERSIASYKGILQHCNSYGFRQKLNEMFRKNRGEQR